MLHILQQNGYLSVFHFYQEVLCVISALSFQVNWMNWSPYLTLSRHEHVQETERLFSLPCELEWS